MHTNWMPGNFFVTKYHIVHGWSEVWYIYVRSVIMTLQYINSFCYRIYTAASTVTSVQICRTWKSTNVRKACIIHFNLFPNSHWFHLPIVSPLRTNIEYPACIPCTVNLLISVILFHFFRLA
jgi:hypothetical protein